MNRLVKKTYSQIKVSKETPYPLRIPMPSPSTLPSSSPFEIRAEEHDLPILSMFTRLIKCRPTSANRSATFPYCSTRENPDTTLALSDKLATDPTTRPLRKGVPLELHVNNPAHSTRSIYIYE